jgi:hypothetical protein
VVGFCFPLAIVVVGAIIDDFWEFSSVYFVVVGHHDEGDKMYDKVVVDRE